ncbi:MAG TPA: twin-arginine translocase subunit TatC [Saprospiraceae bacterium]|nr:twin-arginine translocase subunit TatC [Saprospiraceae bacterium]
MPLDQVDIDKYDQKLGEAKEMSFLDHLEELRWHILKSLAAITIMGIVLFLFKNWFFENIVFGPTHDDFISYRVICNLSEQLGLGSSMCFTPPEFEKIAVGFAESFIMSIKVCFVGGFFVAFPYVFYQVWIFIKPGLYKNERSATRGIVAICSFLFMMGVLFGYFIISPFAINFLGGYYIPGVTNAPTISSFVTYMVMFTAPAGIIFELPIVVYFLSKIGLLTPAVMKKYRRHAIVAVLILAALITPPDVVTQFLIGIPLFVLYELSIYVSRRVEKKEKAKWESGQ